MHSARKYETDFCSGPIFSNVIHFSVPLILTGNLQLLYNAVNIVVVGRFVGSGALAAVGSTTTLTNLIINLFIGLSVGAGLAMANHYGAGRLEEANKTVHTTVAVSMVSGAGLTVFVIFLARPLLLAMGTPGDILDDAALYMRIYFLGMPASMIFNFCSAILRAVGDTRRPFYFLSVSGVVNVALNLIFVLVFHMAVAGVAAATVISQYMSAALILICLIRSDGCIQLRWREIGFDRDNLRELIRIGLPAGLQSTVFSISNVLIQSSVNSFGSLAIAGNAAAMNIEGFVYTSMNSFYQAALVFIGQNVGAKKYRRVGSILGACLVSVVAVGVSFGGLSYLFAGSLLGIYTTQPEVIAYGVVRLGYICLPYFTCGIMDVMAGSVRGMGYSVTPMLVSMAGVCGVRIVWIYTVFAASRSLRMLYISYPISWVATALVHLITYLIIRRKMAACAAVPAEVPCRQN